jgi:hypothetical protein
MQHMRTVGDMEKEMTYPPELMLKCAKLAFPNEKLRLYKDGTLEHCEPLLKCKWTEFDFNPLDPTKGDLAALQNALEDKSNGEWSFRKEGGKFIACSFPLGYEYCHTHYPKIVKADSPAERAMRCVEVMV